MIKISVVFVFVKTMYLNIFRDLNVTTDLDLLCFLRKELYSLIAYKILNYVKCIFKLILF